MEKVLHVVVLVPVLQRIYLQSKEKGTTIVPLEVYAGKNGKIKVKIGVGRGRKKEDKREYIKNRDAKREAKSHENT